MKALRISSVFLLVALAAAPAWAATNDPGYNSQWGIQRIGAESSWSIANGTGLTIGVVDTGADLQHEDLKDKIVAGHDYIDNDDTPQDGDGHGTHVSGIAAATTNNGRGIAGIAPGAQILVVRVLNDFGVNVPRPSPNNLELFKDAAEGVRYAVDRGAKVVNMSLGSVEPGEGPWQELEDALKHAWSKGAIVVIAAGNDSEGPAADFDSGYGDHNAVIVVATTKPDNRASYSNRAGAAKWAISAPGDEIYSTYYDSLLDPSNHSMYASLSGTSMAAPHVSGALAVLMSAGLTAEQAVNRMLANARDVGPAGPDSTYGAGILDIGKAVQGLKPSPSGGAGVSSPPRPTAAGGTSPKGSSSAPAVPSSTQSPSTGASSPDPGTTAAGTEPPGESEGGSGLSIFALAALAAGAGGATFLWFRLRKTKGA